MRAIVHTHPPAMSALAMLGILAAGGIQPVDPVAAREAHDFLLQPAIVNATFAYGVRQARRAG